MSHRRFRVNPLLPEFKEPLAQNRRNIWSLKWLQRDLNPQPLSSKTYTQPFSQTGQFGYKVWVLVYELNGSGFRSLCGHLNFILDVWQASEYAYKNVIVCNTPKMWFHLRLLCNRIKTVLYILIVTVFVMQSFWVWCSSAGDIFTLWEYCVQTNN